MPPNASRTRPTVYASSSQKLWCPSRVKRTAAASAVIAATPASSPRLGAGTPRGDVQAYVVDLHRVAHALRDRVHIRHAQLLGELLEVVAEAHGADVVARLA